MKNYYKILEVDENASDEIIKVAHKSLVKKYHPDLKTGNEKKLAEKKIKEINEAYDVLSDPILKMEYDRKLNENDVAIPQQNEYSQHTNIQYRNIQNFNYGEQKNTNFFLNVFNSLDKDIKTALAILLVFFVIFVFLKIPFLSSLLNNIMSNGLPVLIVIFAIAIYFFFFRKKK